MSSSNPPDAERRRIAGSCSCGSVRFEVTEPTRFVAHCHCTTCRRAHGAGSVTWAGFVKQSVRVIGDAAELAEYHTETDAVRSFCRRCGSPLMYRSPRWPDETHVAVAALDGPLSKLPDAHAYADRAPDWYPISDQLMQFGGESGSEPLA